MKFCKQSMFSDIFFWCVVFFCTSLVSFVFCGLYFLKKIFCLRTKDFFSACGSCDLFTLKIRAYFKLPSWHLLSFWRNWSISSGNSIMRMCMPHFLMISVSETTWNMHVGIFSKHFLRTLEPGPSKFAEFYLIVVHSTLQSLVFRVVSWRLKLKSFKTVLNGFVWSWHRLSLSWEKVNW